MDKEQLTNEKQILDKKEKMFIEPQLLKSKLI